MEPNRNNASLNGGISAEEDAWFQAFFTSVIDTDSDYLDLDERENDLNEVVVADEEKVYSEEEIYECFESVGYFEDDQSSTGNGFPAETDDRIWVTLNYGEMCPSQGTGASFKFQGDEMVTIAMRSSDTLKILKENILSHFDRHLAIEIQSGEELILQSDGEVLTFRDCGMYWGQDIKVILRAPPVDNLPEDSSKLGEIDVIVHAQGLPRFIIPVSLIGTIQDIKQNIKMLTAMDPEKHSLCYKKEVLEDDSVVAMCKLYNNCCIQLVPNGKRIEVTIHAIGFDSFKIKVLLMDTVQVIKQKIETVTSVDQEHQKLYYNNQLLPDNCRIACCGMYDKCQIQAYEPTSRDKVRLSLYYGNFNLPLPSESFLLNADCCLKVLKEKILKNIENCLNLELPSGEIVKIGSECDISLANCQLSGKAIKVLLKSPADTYTRFSTSYSPVKEMVIIRKGTDQRPLLRFKLRMDCEMKVQKLKEMIEMICRVRTLDQRLLNFATGEELNDCITISQICNEIELRI